MGIVKINTFIQARMSSRRFPGKVLAPLDKKPVIKHIIDRMKTVGNVEKVVVLTSLEESDDPLVAYLEKIGCLYFRGSLDNVFERFLSALKIFPCDYFARISADSPLINSALLESMLHYAQENNNDLISNVVERTFPKGQSIEIIKSKIFSSVDVSFLENGDCEHIFPYFYRNKKNYKITSIKNSIDESDINLCVDTLEDLRRLTHAKYSSRLCQEFSC